MVATSFGSLSPWEGSTQPQRSSTTTIEQTTLSIVGIFLSIIFCLGFYHPFVKNQRLFSEEIMVDGIDRDFTSKRADTWGRPYAMLMNTGWRPVLLDG
jgi:hypothetical protein